MVSLKEDVTGSEQITNFLDSCSSVLEYSILESRNIARIRLRYGLFIPGNKCNSHTLLANQYEGVPFGDVRYYIKLAKWCFCKTCRMTLVLRVMEESNAIDFESPPYLQVAHREAYSTAVKEWALSKGNGELYE